MNELSATQQRLLSAFGAWPRRILIFAAALAVPAIGAALIPWDGIAGIVRWGFGYPAFLAFVATGCAMAMVRWRAIRWLTVFFIVPFSCFAALLIWTRRLTVDNMQGYFAFVAICGWVVKATLLALAGVAVAGWGAWWCARRSETPTR